MTDCPHCGRPEPEPERAAHGFPTTPRGVALTIAALILGAALLFVVALVVYGAPV